MNKSIDDRLKDFFGSVYFHFQELGEGNDFIDGIDSQYLDGELKLKKWLLEAETVDKDTSAFKSFAFLSSEEFKKWPDEKKALAFQEYGEKYSGIKKEDSKEDLITLEDYKTLIKNNPTWSPYLKAMSSHLIPEAELGKITFKDLEEIGFFSWPANEQEEFLYEVMSSNEKFLDGLKLDGLLKSDSFKNASDKAKIKLAGSLIETVEDLDKLGISSPHEKLELLSTNGIIVDEEDKFKLDFKTQDNFLNFFRSLLEIDAKDGEKYAKALEEAEKIEDENQKKTAIEKIEKEHKNARPTVEDIKKMSGFADLSPEEKLLVIATARELKISDFESIENLDKITDMSGSDRLFNEIKELNLASVLKSKLPLCIKTAAFNNLKFEDDKNEKGEVVLSADQKKSAALKLVSYPYGIDLFFQKIQESEEKGLVDNDLLKVESMLQECIAAAQTISKDLGLEQADIEKLNALSKEIDDNKGKTAEERIGFLRKFGRILLNILEVPLSIFPLTFAKEARNWFFNPSKQMQYNDSKKQKEKLGGFLSRVKSQNKKENNKAEKGGEAK